MSSSQTHELVLIRTTTGDSTTDGERVRPSGVRGFQFLDGLPPIHLRIEHRLKPVYLLPLPRSSHEWQTAVIMLAKCMLVGLGVKLPVRKTYRFIHGIVTIQPFPAAKTLLFADGSQREHRTWARQAHAAAHEKDWCGSHR